MPQTPAYSITGNSSFIDNSVSFQIAFQNEDDQLLVQAYEWYLDGVLVTNANTQNFVAQVSCGNHTISARLLYGLPYESVWTGTQEFSFKTCNTIISIYISGPDQVALNESATYTVICEYTDGTSEDVTDQYTFSCSAGGSFTGNIFTATGGSSLTPPFGITITATPEEGTPLIKDITVTGEEVPGMGTLVVDLYNNSTLNVIGLIDNAEVVKAMSLPIPETILYQWHPPQPTH